MGFVVIGVGYLVAEFSLQLGELDRRDAIDRRMAAYIRGVVREGAQGECIFVQIGGVAKKRTSVQWL